MELSNAQIRQALAPFGVDLGDHLVGQIRTYLRLLLVWNQKVNLTSITQPQAVLTRHFGESMFGAPLLARPDGALADVGSGAGFPGLALKLVCPALRVKLIEPAIKKAVFLSEVVRTLELSGVEVIREPTGQVRAMDADVVTARAVGNLPGLVKWASSVVTSQGQVLLWLGREDAMRVSEFAGWDWSEPVPIPDSTQRVILSGRRAA
jgi:16S rRNA (guanine527-N7)-methyltransferase